MLEAETSRRGKRENKREGSELVDVLVIEAELPHRPQPQLQKTPLHMVTMAIIR